MKSFITFICLAFLSSLLDLNEILPQSSFINAIDFDGDGDYANTFNNPYFPTINGTIEAWIKVTSISLPGGNQGEAFVAKNEEQWNNGDFYAFFEYYNGRLKSRIQKPPSIEVDVISNSNFLQNLEQWFHYAFTWGANGMRLYINGELQSSQNSLTYSALNNEYNFYVGAHGYMLHNGQYVVADFFDGQLDELRIWNYQKNSQQINALMNSPLDSAYFVSIDSGLVGYWRFDVLEDLGINNDGPDDVRDLSVLQNHLDLAGNAHLVPYIPVTTNIFEKTFGGIGLDGGIGIDITPDGGYIITGFTSTFSSDQDMYLIKLDENGSLEWSKVYHSSGSNEVLQGVKVIPEGGYYLVGQIEGGFGFIDHGILKVDTVGNIIWAKNFGGIEADVLRDVSVTADGGIIVSGFNSSFGAGAKDVQAIKLSSDGTVEWAKTYGSFYEEFNGTNIVLSDGQYLFAGDTDISGFYNIRPLLIKTDTSGNIIWAKVYSGYLEDWARFAIETADGGFLITGDTRSYGLGGSQDIYLIKTDSSGNIEWARAYGGIGNESGYCVLQNYEGKYVIAGFTDSFGFGGKDAFLMKVDLNGTLDWFYTYGGQQNDYAFWLKETPDSGYVMSGRRSSNSLGSEDVYIVKTDKNGYSGCDFGSFNPNVFNITNIQAINANLSTSSNIAVANLTLSLINPNTAQNNTCGIIPVELKSFNYILENNDVVLSWSTATETNNMGFKILRDDSEIGFVAGSGTTTEPRLYSFKDENVSNGSYLYSLIQIDYDGTSEKVGEVEIIVNNLPSNYRLEQNYPNPFNPTTKIRYSVPKRSHILMVVYDFLGQKVMKLVDEIKDAGFYQLEFDGRDLPSGVYFYSLISERYTATKKMLLLK